MSFSDKMGDLLNGLSENFDEYLTTIKSALFSAMDDFVSPALNLKGFLGCVFTKPLMKQRRNTGYEIFPQNIINTINFRFELMSLTIYRCT